MIEYYPTPVEWCHLAYDALDLEGSLLCADWFAGDGVMGRTMKAAGYCHEIWAVEQDIQFKPVLRDFDHVEIDDVFKNECSYDRIVLNPPFSLWSRAFAFARQRSEDVIIFAPSTYLEGQARYEDFWSKGGVSHVVQFTCRLRGHGGFDNKGRIFIRWQKKYKKEPLLRWVNPSTNK